MKYFKLLNKKDIKKLNLQLKRQFDNEFDFKSYLVYKTPKNRVYIVNKEFSKLDKNKLKINNIGLYIFSIEDDGLRFSIDGSQMFKAKKNIIELNEKQFKEWMTGNNLDIKTEEGYYIIKYKDYFLGCGKSSGEKVYNYVPKERRVVF